MAVAIDDHDCALKLGATKVDRIGSRRLVRPAGVLLAVKGSSAQDEIDAARERFAGLRRLSPGDRIEVSREDGTTAAFTVERAQQYAKDEFPTLEVYGNTAGAELRLKLRTGGTEAHQFPTAATLAAIAAQLSRSSLGDAALVLVAVGFLALVLWQLVEAAVGHRRSEGGKRVLKRLGSLGKAVVYAVLGYSAFGTSGIQLLKYLIGPLWRIPSTCVKTNVISESASVTEIDDVAA